MLSAKKRIANNICYFLDLYGWSQSKLARRIDVSTATISDWTNRKKSPSPDNLDSIAEAFNIDVCDLLVDRQSADYEDVEAIEFQVLLERKADARWILGKLKAMSDPELRALRVFLDQMLQLQEELRRADNGQVHKRR